MNSKHSERIYAERRTARAEYQRRRAEYLRQQVSEGDAVLRKLLLDRVAWLEAYADKIEQGEVTGETE